MTYQTDCICPECCSWYAEKTLEPNPVTGSLSIMIRCYDCGEISNSQWDREDSEDLQLADYL